MYFVKVWDGMTNTTYRIEANTLCEARMKARRKHQLTVGADWCEITKVSHRMF